MLFTWSVRKEPGGERAGPAAAALARRRSLEPFCRPHIHRAPTQRVWYHAAVPGWMVMVSWWLASSLGPTLGAPICCLAAAGGDTAITTPEAISQQPPAAKAASIKEQQEELARRRHSVEQTLAATESDPSRVADANVVRTELDLLKYYEVICAQQSEELARTNDLQNELKQCQTQLQEFRLAGPEEPKPYSILLLDDVQDQLDAEKTRIETLGMELSAAKDVQPATQRLHKEAETKRRQTRESMEAAQDEQVRQRYAKQLEFEQLQSQLYADIVQLRRTEIANKELERQISECRATYLQEKLAAVAANTVFTNEHLQAILAELDKFEGDLRAQLPVLQARLKELETQAFDAAKEQQQRNQSLDKQLEAEMQSGWQLSKRNCQIQMKMIQQRLRDLVAARLEWNIRYKVFNGTATREELVQWQEDAQLYVQRIETSRHVLEEESKSLMVELGARKNSCASCGGPFRRPPSGLNTRLPACTNCRKLTPRIWYKSKPSSGCSPS